MIWDVYNFFFVDVADVLTYTAPSIFNEITVGFFELAGDQILNVSYKGPTGTKTAIPASALYRSPVAYTLPEVSITSPGNGQTIVSSSTNKIDVSVVNETSVAKVELCKWCFEISKG